MIPPSNPFPTRFSRGGDADRIIPLSAITSNSKPSGGCGTGGTVTSLSGGSFDSERGGIGPSFAFGAGTENVNCGVCP